MTYLTVTTCAMRYPKEGSGIVTKICSCHGHVVPNSTSHWPIYLPLYHVLSSLRSRYNV